MLAEHPKPAKTSKTYRLLKQFFAPLWRAGCALAIETQHFSIDGADNQAQAHADVFQAEQQELQLTC